MLGVGGIAGLACKAEVVGVGVGFEVEVDSRKLSSIFQDLIHLFEFQHSSGLVPGS